MKKEISDKDLDKSKDSFINIRLIPAIIQDYNTKEVLMLAYMSKESLKKSIQTGTTWFWSRKRKKLWNKGETSGNIQKVKQIEYDCDGDTLLVKVEQVGNACHTGKRSCFFRSLDIKTKNLEKTGWIDLNFNYHLSLLKQGADSILSELYNVIKDRIESKSSSSYTYALHKKGLDEIIKKVGEECIEMILSSKYEDKKRVIYEISDLLYHLLVLIVEKKITLEQIFDELKSRRK